MFGFLKKIFSSNAEENIPKKDGENKKTEYQETLDKSMFYRPDTRTEDEKDAAKRTYLHPDAYAVSNGVCGVGQSNFERLLATSNVVIGAKYSCPPDNFSCPKCWPLDGQEYPCDISKRPPVPRHENCRCLYLPCTAPRKHTVDLGEVERTWIIGEYQHTFKKDPSRKLKKPRRIVHRHGRFTGTVEDWIRSLPKKEQRQFFPSDTSYALWSQGKIRAIEMLDPETWELRTDDELKKIAE